MDSLEVIPPKAKANKLPKTLLDLSNDGLNEHITTNSIKLYGDQPKDLQVEAVLSLVQGHHTFVRAGTGFGKTRISEMFFGLFKKKVFVLVLNPLDSLGDDQVREKKLLNITAINLKIKQGKYSFVYLSPEVFLNSALFTDLFFSDEFQDRLALIVIDEAHMIYLWGLVASRQSKHLISFERLDDRGIFRPSYGHLGTRLMATNNVPLLLLSATCRPVAIASITTSLMLQSSDIKMVDGELTRPEIRFIRIPMQHTLGSCDDLLRFFAPHSYTSSKETVPTIIYSGTRNRTFQALKVVNEAQHTPKNEFDLRDSFIRRFHSVTSDTEKAQTMEDFSAGNFPVISATMALGLGQNLKRVRQVIHVGRGDPASIVQMVGRCGRDGNTGLGLLLMEPNRQKGRNSVSDFEDGLVQDDDVRMDALAVTPLCLRVVLTVDNKVGYIPLSEKDTNYIAEREREEKAGFPKCKCSNCAPEAAAALLNVIQQANIHNFDRMLDDPWGITKDTSLAPMTRLRKKQARKGTCSYPESMSIDLENHLVNAFNQFYGALLGSSPEFGPEMFFGPEQAHAIVGSIDQVRNGEYHDTTLLENLIGGQMLDGQIECLDQAITDWMDSEFYIMSHLREAEHDLFIDSERVRILETAAANREKNKALAAAKRLKVRLALAAEKNNLKSQHSAQLLSEKIRIAEAKAEEKARIADEKASEKARIADDKAAEKALIAAEKAAEIGRLIESKANKTPPNDIIPNIPSGITDTHTPVNHAARIKARDEARANEAMIAAEQKRLRRESIEAKKMAAQAKKADRNRRQTAKLLAECQARLALSQMHGHQANNAGPSHNP